MLGLAPRLRRAVPILLEGVFGTGDSGEIEAAIVTLPLEIVRCFHFEVSVGAVLGLELADGSRIALKVHQPQVPAARLDAQQAVQAHIAERGFPCPRPTLGPTPVGLGLATGEEWRAEGRRYAAVTPARRRSMAEALVRLIQLARETGPTTALETPRPPDGLWPEPHNALFDFERSRRGAEEIDEIGRRARERMFAGPRVVAHRDWSIKHFRFRAGGDITVVYDWDSLFRDYESVALGAAAATHTAAIHARVLRPTVEDALAFAADYEGARGGLDANMRRAGLAAAVYAVAYTARCEHALVASGTRR